MYVKKKNWTLPDALRALRKARGWSQARLARELKRSITALASWEQGLHEPHAEVCEKLAALCDGELSAFFAHRADLAPEPLPRSARSAPASRRNPSRAADRLTAVENQLAELAASFQRLEAKLTSVLASPGIAPGVTVRPATRISSTQHEKIRRAQKV